MKENLIDKKALDLYSANYERYSDKLIQFYFYDVELLPFSLFSFPSPNVQCDFFWDYWNQEEVDIYNLYCIFKSSLNCDDNICLLLTELDIDFIWKIGNNDNINIKECEDDDGNGGDNSKDSNNRNDKNSSSKNDKDDVWINYTPTNRKSTWNFCDYDIDITTNIFSRSAYLKLIDNIKNKKHKVLYSSTCLEQELAIFAIDDLFFFLYLNDGTWKIIFGNSLSDLFKNMDNSSKCIIGRVAQGYQDKPYHVLEDYTLIEAYDVNIDIVNDRVAAQYIVNFSCKDFICPLNFALIPLDLRKIIAAYLYKK